MLINEINEHLKNMINTYGIYGVPPRCIFDPGEEKITEVVREENESYKVSYMITNKGTLVGNPIFTDTDEETKKLVMYRLENTYKLIISEPLAKYLTMPYNFDENYYCEVARSISSYDKRWLKTRKVVFEDVEFREITEDDMPKVKELMDCWRDYKSTETKVYFKRMYNSIVTKNEYFGNTYKGYGLFYKGVLTMFRYYRLDNGIYCTVDMEHGAGSFTGNDNVLNKYLSLNISDILKYEKVKVSDIVSKKLEEYNKMKSERLELVSNKNWKKVKQIDPKIKLAEESLLEYKNNWKINSIEEFKKFLKDSCVNTNRYLFMKHLKDINAEYYFEDFAVIESLKEYKKNKNDFGVKYYSSNGENYY